MLKKLLLLVSLIPVLSHAGEITYPGEAWVRYAYSAQSDQSDYDHGLLFADIIQGVEYNRNMLYLRGSSYEPALAGGDNFISYGVKHKTKYGVDFGVEKQFVDNDVDRTVMFTEFYKTWGSK